MPIPQDQQDAIELHAHRVFAKGVDQYRAHLESQFKLLTWAIGLIVIVGLFCAAWILGKDYKALHELAEQKIEQELQAANVDGKLDARLQQRLDSQIDSVDERLRKAVEAALTAEAGTRLNEEIEAVAERITNSEIQLLPRGTIIAWQGEEIPQGWAVCDGNNETPNLQGVFLMGTSHLAEAGERGGRAELPARRMRDENREGEGHYVPIVGRSQSTDLRPPFVKTIFLIKL